MNGDDQPKVRAAAFSEQISELQGLAEMADMIKTLAQEVEIRMLGHAGPHGEKKEQVYDTSSPLSLVAAMRNSTRLTHESLQAISDSLHRITEELGGVGLNEPEEEDSNSGAPGPLSFRR